MSTVCNVVPQMCRTIHADWRQGRLQTACNVQRQLAPLEACLAANNPAALKYALSLLGFMHPDTRLPIVELEQPAKAVVARIVAGLDAQQLALVGG